MQAACNMDFHVGNSLLKKFENSRNEIVRDSRGLAGKVKKISLDRQLDTDKWMTYEQNLKALYKQIQILPELYKAINGIAVGIGQLEAELEDVGAKILILEAVCREEEIVRDMREEIESAHSQKLGMRKDLERIKGDLASRRIDDINHAEAEMARQRIDSEKAIKEAIEEVVEVKE